MASVTYGKCIMANVIMAKILMAKILWQMDPSRIRETTFRIQLIPIRRFYDA